MVSNPRLMNSFLLSILFIFSYSNTRTTSFSVKEATIHDLQLAFSQNLITSTQLVEFYFNQIHTLNPLLRAVIEVNPDAISQAQRADQERKTKAVSASLLPPLHGIPILLKDNIATKDKLNTTAGSFALLGSVVPRDAGVVEKLRKARAIILGKASLSEWSYFRSSFAPSGFCGRTGQGKNPYVLSESPCGSSSGSSISVAANLAAVSLGTETDGSILCPAGANSVVGIKPTVGLTSRAGVIPISPRQDTVGPICRTVSDAVYVLDAIVGVDHNDGATKEAAKYIPQGGYKQGRIQSLLKTLRGKGAVLVDHLEIANLDVINSPESGEEFALVAEFKPALNAYLKQLVSSPVRTLADVITYNKKFSKLEKVKEYGQDILESAESLNVTEKQYKMVLSQIKKLSRYGMGKLMRKHKLDALVTPGSGISQVLAIGGHPGISVPAGYDGKGLPVGICFAGLRGTEPKLIEIAYGFEQATKIRKPPSFLP